MKDENLSKEQRFTRIRNHIDRMPSLSTTVTRVLDICNRADTSPKDLNKVIALDPVLTGQVLKLINSAYYALPNKITTLTRAIIMLGLNTVKNLALSTAVLGIMRKQEGASQGLAMDHFWTHSICVGVVARALAGAKGISAMLREEAFVAGLLHDLGKVVLSSCFSGQYDQALEAAGSGHGSLRAAETEIFGFDHGLVGRMIAEKWQLSEVIIDTLGCHHEPAAAGEENQQLVAIVALANLYANSHAIGSAGNLFQDQEELRQVLEMVGMAWDDLDFLQETVEEEIEKARIFLQVPRSGG